MLVVALVLAGLAAALHVYIWAMESLLWTTPRVRATFGVSEADAETTRGLALNQGFYNLFLAIVTSAGIVAFGRGADAVGAALVIAGVGSMLAAAGVLVLSDPTKASAAVKQGAVPMVVLVLLAIAPR
jgi:putative membrane protein